MLSASIALAASFVPDAARNWIEFLAGIGLVALFGPLALNRNGAAVRQAGENAARSVPEWAGNIAVLRTASAIIALVGVACAVDGLLRIL